jgi:hypothetical protein
MTTARFAVAAAGLTLLLAACGDSGPGDLTNPDIRGKITVLTPTPESGDVLGSALIEGDVEPGTQYDKATVRVVDSTDIYQMVSGEPEDASFGDLAEGQTVEAWFEGAVAESYPVQATAGKILIIE